MEKILKALERAQLEAGHVAAGRSATALRFQAHVQPESAPASRPAPRTRVEPVSEAALAANRLVAGLPEHKLGDTFRVLRTRVLQLLEENDFSTLMIASPNPGDGKSVVAANLAISLAKLATRSVLLVDADLRRPSVHKLFSVSGTPGLVDYLEERAALHECLVRPGIESLVLLPAGPPMENSSELLTGPLMTGLATELKARYPDRIVIYDAPPLLTSDDAIAFSGYVDCGLLVAAEGETPVSDIEQTLMMLSGLPILGTVLNKSNESPRSYYGS
ncbi:CpsD/CapB family tyrosine-protein kinase [Ferruginivarius sediminum]|uniref:Exopolysaccharide biosynthesis protein n=1 Tax=Ferruginivarius sediminum TaxID=2661937 RepID=A0A369TAE6_9PROT|nr:CpsD/CapB family tyrosine-protein kinase [Ferruginivarius sediminum]RDD62301.1 exopolysaccharide biosynthesis protein [Ferruginivarius sediminum]